MPTITFILTRIKKQLTFQSDLYEDLNTNLNRIYMPLEIIFEIFTYYQSFQILDTLNC